MPMSEKCHVYRYRAVRLTLCLSAALVFAGCQEPPAPVPQDIARPAEILEVGSASIESGLSFPGRVRAMQRAELAFKVPGQIVEFPVREGEAMPAGSLVARLDPAAYETRLAAARAEFEKARTDFERAQAIWDKSQAVPRAEVDARRTAMEVARSTYAAARKEFEDTRLAAPFDGVIARRYVENFQNVQANEPVASLQSTEHLEIVIHVPERVVRGEPKRAAGYARFEDLPGLRLPVTLKSFATEADAQTQTYEVVLELTRPQDVTILPGMSAEVLPQTAAEGAGRTQVLIPLKAVSATADGAPSVWVVDPATSRVQRRVIEAGEVQGSDIVVLAGLEPGERIVTAGVGHLREGMRVHPL